MADNVALFKPYLSASMEQAALEVLRSGQIAAGGKVQQFEAALGRLIGQAQVLTTSDMSSALQIALRLADVGPQEEVLTTAYTCMSSNGPIAAVGATPRWVDVRASTGTMDPAALEQAITPRSKACLVYHAAGYPAEIQTIAAICRHRGIVLIEDCNNALGAEVQGRPVGTFGDMAVYSFYPNRQINASEGGALALRDPAQLARARRLRRFGIDMTTFRDASGEINPASDIAEIGWSAGMNNLCSALALAQLEGLDERLAATRRNASRLATLLEDIEGVQVIQPNTNSRPVYWALLVLIDQQRDEVLQSLKQAGVMVSKLHHQTDGYSGFHAQPASLPATTAFMEKVLALPCGWWLGEAELDRIATATAAAIANSSKA